LRPAPQPTVVRTLLRRELPRLTAALYVAGAVGCCWLFYSEFRAAVLTPEPVSVHAPMIEANPLVDPGESDLPATSSYPQTDRRSFGIAAVDPVDKAARSRATMTVAEGEAASQIIAREFSLFDSVMRQAAVRPLSAAKMEAKPSAKAMPEEVELKEINIKSAVRVAALETPASDLHAILPVPEVIRRGVPADVAAKTTIAEFETSPFPYQTTRIHFRRHASLPSQTFSDDHVLLHIPHGFDPKRPAVMVVFFHGHGAILSRDVRDRQMLAAQVSASGANAILVAPQFAYDAANSSPGKFGESNGFRRFLDEAAVKLAALYGDQRTQKTFAAMPIVLISYSGGYGPTLSVLERGGANARIHGLVLMDSIYSGVDTFADWIANHRSAFFISSFTPHLAHRNAELQALLGEKDVPYGSELRRTHLQGSVTFLPAGPISHRDFLTRGWTDSPVVDILARMDDIDQNIQTAATASMPATASAAAVPRN